MPTYDRVTASLERFAHEHIGRIFERAHRLARGNRTVLLPFAQHASDVDREAIREVNARLLAAIEPMCRRSELFRLLILCRKVPCTVIPGLLPGLRSEETLSLSHQAVFVEGVLFATNCLLHWASNGLDVNSINDRNFIDPSDGEMEDAILLMALSWLHRYNAYLLNAVARISVTSSEEFDSLIEMYNKRQHSAMAVDLAEDEQWTPWGLTTVRSLPFDNWIEVPSASGWMKILLPNYFPVPADAETTYQKYSYLDHGDFEDQHGLSFPEYWECWLGMNELWRWSLPRWTPGTRYLPQSPRDALCFERFFDICETGMSGGSLRDIRTASPPLLREGRSSLPPDDRFSLFVESVMFDSIEGSVEFVEQPFLLYRVGSDTILWDHLRHGGLLKAVARKAVRRSGRIGARKGEVFETKVAHQLEAAGVSQVAMNVKLGPANRPSFEIDVAFVVDRILFLVEAKSWLKRLGEYDGNPVEVGDRIRRAWDALAELDAHVKQHERVLKDKWPDAIGAISLVCSDEAEFIPTLDETAWLVKGVLPRVCLLEELCELLSHGEPSCLRKHKMFHPL